jgi:hypothetical protein
MWHGEALCGLGVLGVGGLLMVFVGSFFLPSVTPASQQDF